MNFEIPSHLERCRQPLAWGGLGVMGMAIAGIVVARRVRTASVPPTVSGTLRWWLVDQPASEAQERDLTAFARASITIGSHSDCYLSISTGGLAERHAILLAEKTEDGVALYLQPVSAVKKGYSLLRTRFLLAHADQFIMGGLNFQYLSDSGE